MMNKGYLNGGPKEYDQKIVSVNNLEVGGHLIYKYDPLFSNLPNAVYEMTARTILVKDTLSGRTLYIPILEFRPSKIVNDRLFWE